MRIGKIIPEILKKPLDIDDMYDIMRMWVSDDQGAHHNP
jgi:hypothetical protein